MSRYIACLLALMLLLTPQSPYAGFTKLSMFSRANCSVPIGGIPIIVGFNESITWDGSGKKWKMYTKSDMSHCNNSGCTYKHFSSEEEESTWRSYAGCMWCGIYGWQVYGEHYIDGLEADWNDPDLPNICELYGTGMASPSLSIPLCKFTGATDCNLTEWRQ